MSNLLYYDLGANKGKTYADFKRENPTLHRSFLFEPNPELAGRLKDRYEGDTSVSVIEAAASFENGVRPFYPGLKSSEAGTCMKGKTNTKYPVNYNVVHWVKQLDLAEHMMMHVDPFNARVVMKMDVEGFEYTLIPHLFKQGVLRWIEELRVEWHNKKFSVPRHVHDEAVGMLRDSGVKVIPWK